MLRDGRRIETHRVDFNILVFVSTAYVMAYFILSCFLTLVLSGASTITYTCTKHIVGWFEVSAIFYLACFVIGMLTFFIIRRRGLTAERVNLGSFELVFFVYRPCWVYLLLGIIDLVHIGLTAWGTFEFFTDLAGIMNCYFEIPILSNFMFIIVIVGYIIIARLLVMLFHFKYGIRILRWVRRTFRYFRRFDQELNQ